MKPIDPPLLIAAMAGITGARATTFAPHYAEAAGIFEWSTPERFADVIAQTGHETNGLVWLRELWGPTSEQVTYERDFAKPWGPQLVRGDRNFKAYTLGNEQPGDGRRYAGAGAIQSTGRANARRATVALRALFGSTQVPDFEADPAARYEPRWAVMIAGDYWLRNGLNALADSGQFITQTKRINGGTNGLSDRQARRVRARHALGLGA